MIRIAVSELERLISTKNVVGEPIAMGDRVMIPISGYGFGFGGVAGSGSGVASRSGGLVGRGSSVGSGVLRGRGFILAGRQSEDASGEEHVKLGVHGNLLD